MSKEIMRNTGLNFGFMTTIRSGTYVTFLDTVILKLNESRISGFRDVLNFISIFAILNTWSMMAPIFTRQAAL